MDRFEVVIHETASSDIREIVSYISQSLREPGTARTMAERLKEEILSLSSMPERFSLVGDSFLSSNGIRMTSVGNYLILFTINKEAYQVNVIRVLYGNGIYITL